MKERYITNKERRQESIKKIKETANYLKEDEICNTIRWKYFRMLIQQYSSSLRMEVRKLPLIEKLYMNYAKECKKRKKVFELTLYQFEQLKSANCVYCDSSPSPYNGIDRIDSKIGYLFDNCQPCCTTCNMMKHTLTHEDFLNKVKIIYEKFK